MLGCLNVDFDLTEEQLKIINESSNSNILIKAVAGSGKTSILLKTVEKFLDDSEEPEKKLKKILVLTFSDSAAAEFRKRLREILKEKYNIVDELTNVTTIHSFALKIITENLIEYRFNIEIDVEDEIMIKMMRREAWIRAREKFNDEFKRYQEKLFNKNVYPYGIYDRDLSLENVIFYIYNYQKRYGYTDDRIENLFQNLSMDEEKEMIKKLYFEYRRVLDDIKRKSGMIDYDDILFFASEIIKKNNLNRYDLIIVDEAQDTSYIQMEIIKSISGGSRLIMAGDYMQSIYEWRDAEPDYIEDIAKNFNMKIFNMQINFRSNENILNFVNNLFNSLKNKSEAINSNFYELKPNGIKKEGDVIIKKFKDSKNATEERLYEANYIADMILKLNRNGVRYDDIAILFRSKKHIMEYVNALKEKNIKYTVITEKSIFDEIEIKVLIDLFYLMEYLKNKKMDIYNKIEFRELLYILFKCTINENCEKEAEKLCDFMQEYLNIIDDSKKLDFAISFLKKFDFINKILVMNNPYERLVNIRKFFSILTKIEEDRVKRLNEFLYILNEYSNEKFDVISLNSATDSGVKLMTIHQSKGLEFPVVILANTTFKTKKMRDFYFHRKHGIGFPNTYLIKEELYKKIEDEIIKKEIIENLRILYVALTRAKNLLIIPLHEKNIKKMEEKAIKTFNEIILENIDENIYERENEIMQFRSEYKGKQEDYFILKNEYKDIQIEKERNYISVEELARFIHIKENVFSENSKLKSFDENAIKGSIFHEKIKYMPVNQILENIFGDETEYKKEIERIIEHCKHPRYEYPISLYYRGLIINGRIDIFCKNIILEFKTGKEKEEDMNQIKLYLYMVNKILNYEDLEGFLIYINDKKIKRVEFDKNIENEIENLMENNNKNR